MSLATKLAHESWRIYTNQERKNEYPSDFTKSLKYDIRKIFNFACQMCHRDESKLLKKLKIHHLDCDKKNCSKDNLVPLCNHCHTIAHMDIPFWKEYFRIKLFSNKNE